MTGAPAILLPFALAFGAQHAASPSPATLATAPLPALLATSPSPGPLATSPSPGPLAGSPSPGLVEGSPSPSPLASPPSPEPLATSPGGIPSPSAAPVPGSTNLPQTEPSATAPANAAPTSSATPTPYGYRFVPHQPAHPVPGTPQIYAIWLNSRTLVSKGPIWIKVATDPETVKVTSSSGGHVGLVPMIAPGDFEAKSILPKFPFIAGGLTLDLIFTAVGPDGKRTTVSVPVGLK